MIRVPLSGTLHDRKAIASYSAEAECFIFAKRMLRSLTEWGVFSQRRYEDGE